MYATCLRLNATVFGLRLSFELVASTQPLPRRTLLNEIPVPLCAGPHSPLSCCNSAGPKYIAVSLSFLKLGLRPGLPPPPHPRAARMRFSVRLEPALPVVRQKDWAPHFQGKAGQMAKTAKTCAAIRIPPSNCDWSTVCFHNSLR